VDINYDAYFFKLRRAVIDGDGVGKVIQEHGRDIARRLDDLAKEFEGEADSEVSETEGGGRSLAPSGSDSYDVPQPPQSG
jgi:isocitrate/isopropylmalate dehydrogenase